MDPGGGERLDHDHVESAVLEDRLQSNPDCLGIVDDEDRSRHFVRLPGTHRRWSLMWSSRQYDRRPGARRVGGAKLERAPRPSAGSLRDVEAKAEPARLGREERLEAALCSLAGQTGAIVDDLDHGAIVAVVP